MTFERERPGALQVLVMSATVVGMLILLALLLTARPAGAQTQDPTAAPSVDDELLNRIAVLETQLADLKAAVAARRNGAPAGEASSRGASAASSGTSAAAQDSAFVDALRQVRVGGSLDLYYGYNFNRPVGRVNLLRAYDVTSNNFTLSQASLVLEKAPDVSAGRRFGARLDLQYGQATETLQGSLANEPRPWVYRNIFQAYGTYVFPLGSGLNVDVGKWASSIGLESNYTKDQINYSRSYWFDFLPFYHMGVRASYRASDALALNYWLTNGAQQSETFNDYMDQMFGAVLNPVKSVTWTTNVYLGQEHPDVEQVVTPGPPLLPTQPGLSVTPIVPAPDGRLHIFDSYATWQATPRTTFALEGDYVVSRLWDTPGPGRSTDPSRVYGGALYARQQVAPRVAVAARGEYLRDQGGLFTGRTQSLNEITLTSDFAVADGFLVRAEWRRDGSSAPFFLTRDEGVFSGHQHTATLGAIWWFGNKQGAW